MLDSLTLSESQKASLGEAAARYHENVNDLGSYLEGRGIDRAAAVGHLLGKVSEPAHGHERFEGWMSIPYLTLSGVVAFKFRCLEDHDHKALGHGKYDAPAGQKIRLYNARMCAEKGDTIAIVEGELDSIVGSSVLGVPTVGTWGTNWMEWYPRCFADFDRILVIADNDHPKPLPAREGKAPEMVSPGRKFAEKVRKEVNGELVLPPAGMDLSEWVAQDGADVVRKAMGL